MNGHTENTAACPAALSAHIRRGPNRSTSLPIGSAARNPATPAMVSPRPTCAAERPTTWVKKTAEPVMKVPSPTARSEEHTSELQSLMRISYAVFCLKKKNTDNNHTKSANTYYNKNHTMTYE